MQDTDADWAIWGEGEPYFGVLSEPRFLRANITPADLEDFWASGRTQVAGLRTLLARHFGDFTPATALDFGCGVGRLTHGLAAFCDHVVGLDISPGMLAEARRHAPDNAEFLMDLTDQTFDWLNSIIVFQHIPPARGYAILDDLLGRVSSGGVISLHITLYKDATFLPHLYKTIHGGRWDGQGFTIFDVEPAPPGAMMMYDYDMSRIIEMTARHGFHNILTQHTNHGGCHGVVMFGRKGY